MLTALSRPEPASVIPSRPRQVVIRRRQVLAALLSGAVGSGLLGLIPGFGLMWWAAAFFVLLAAGYVALVAHVRHMHVVREMALAFGDPGDIEFDWTELERGLSLELPVDDHPPFAVPVEIGNKELARFLVSYTVGWLLTPVVMVIRLLRGDPAVAERNGVIGRIVRLQQYGRSQSLRILTVGAAATVGITAVGGMTAGAATGPRVTATAHPQSTLTATSGASYTVRRGDTLSAIAARHGTTVADLLAANHVSNPNVILPGQVLMIPGSGPVVSVSMAAGGSTTYTVQRGDTLGAIAARRGTTVAIIAAANHLANPNLIFPGQALTVPAVATAAVPTASPAPVPAAAHPVAATVTATSGAGLPLPAQYLHGGTIDQGVDYSAPGATPLYAMGDGVIIREGMSGFGPATPCLQITSGPLAGRTVYYGHAGPNLVHVGDHVVKGQQISIVGNGIVGFSTGPHLEIGFYPPGGRGAGRPMLDYINGVVGHPTGG